MTERFDLEKAVKITGLNIHAESADEGRDFDVACIIILQALEEIQQYRAIGTIEEFKALKLKEHNYDNCHNLTCRRKCEKDGYVKSIDEFAEQMSLEISESIIWGMLFDNRDNSSYDTADKIVDYVIDTDKKIAEQMKGDVVNG